jgi:hypothetical protein
MIPIIFLVILPSISIPVSLITQYKYPNDILFFFVIFYYILILFIVSFVYGIYPVWLALFRKIRKKRKIDYENTVIEFEFIKKVLFIGYPILFSIGIFLYFFYSTFSSYEVILALQVFNISLFFGGFVRIIAQTAKRRFRVYFAKGCCKIITTKEDNFEKTKYLFLALDSYNKYLRRNTKYGINAITKIHSLFLSSSPKEKGEIISSVCKSLDCDSFKLAEYLSILSDIPDTELFIRESILQKLKPIGIFLAAAIPIIISLIPIMISLIQFILG